MACVTAWTEKQALVPGQRVSRETTELKGSLKDQGGRWRCVRLASRLRVGWAEGPGAARGRAGIVCFEVR